MQQTALERIALLGRFTCKEYAVPSCQKAHDGQFSSVLNKEHLPLNDVTADETCRAESMSAVTTQAESVGLIDQFPTTGIPFS